MNTKAYIETDSQYVPTGNIIPEEWTEPKLGNHILNGQGLNKYLNFKNDRTCVLKDPLSGRTMTLDTSYPGLQLYTGDFLKSNEKGVHGKPYKPLDGLCLECHYYPDFVNNINFKSFYVTPDIPYSEYISLSFGIDN